MRSRSELWNVATAAGMLVSLGSVLHAQDSPTAQPVPAAASTIAAELVASVPRAPVSFAVVTSPSVPITGLSLEDLRNVFFFRKKFWSGGKRVVLLLPAPGLDARNFLLADIYRLNDAGLQRLILEKLFQGEIDLAPRVVNSYHDAFSFVAGARGMLSIVPMDAIPADQSRFKVLRINGKLPGDEGYPLRSNQ